MGAAIAADAVPTAPEVVVTADRMPLPAEDVGSAVTVITADEIARRQLRTVADVLRAVPGVAVGRSGPEGALTQVRIRGAEANQTLVAIDGMEVNDPSGGSEFDFGNLLAVDIARIEILRGPQSALYGSDAIGGVVNIVTTRGQGTPGVRASAEAGSYQSRRLSAGAQGAGEWGDFAVGVTGFATNGVSSAPKNEGNVESDGHENRTINAKLGLTPTPDLDVVLTGRYVRSVTETDPQPSVAGVIRTVDGTEETRTIQRMGRASATYGAFDGGWEHTVGAGFNAETSDSFTGRNVTYEADGTKLRFDYQSNVFFDTPAVADAAHTLTLLAERETETQVTRSAYGSSDFETTNHGLVGGYRVGLWDRVFVGTSVRRDFNDIFADATTTRATVSTLLDPAATRLHASAGTGVKNPTLTELFGYGPNFVPNPALQPEKSRGWDFGVEQRLWGDRARIDVTLFENRISNLIQGAGNTARNLEGVARIRGVEASAKADFGGGLTLDARYTFMAGDDAAGAALTRRPKHRGGVDLGYRFLDGKARLGFGLDVVGEQRDTQFSNSFADRKAVALDGYVLGTLTASYAIVEGTELYGRVENLFDQEYQDVLGFANPGIAVFVGVRATVGRF